MKQSNIMVLDNIKNSAKHLYERFNSPFGGTFITVWAFHHWQLVYSFFTFDEDCTLNDRIYILQQYLDKSNTCELFWWPLTYTFLVIVLFLIFSNLGYAAIVIAEKWAKPSIFYFIDRNKNAPREDLDKMKIRTRGLQIDLQKSEDEVQQAHSEIQELKIKLTSTETEVYNLREIQKEQTFKLDICEKEKMSLEEDFNNKLTIRVNSEYQEMAKWIHAKKILNANTIFHGVWKLKYITSLGVSSSEKFIVSKDNKYIVVDKIVYTITDMHSIENGKFIVFTKRQDGNPEINLVNRLIRTVEGGYTGYENDNLKVEYAPSSAKSTIKSI